MGALEIANYFDILNQSQKAYNRQLEPICKKWGLTRSELDVMLFLYNNPEYDRAADIVSRRGMTKSHVSLSVTNLESRALLVRQFSPTDRRTAHLALTESGQEIAREGREAQKTFFRLLYSGITPEEMTLWREIIKKVCENIKSLEK